MSFPDNEPAITAGGLCALAAALLAVLAAFGLPITPDQQKAILGLVAVIAPIVVALLIRPHVTPQAHIDAVPVAARAMEQAEAAKA